MRTPENSRSCDFALWIFGLAAQLLVDFSQDCTDISGVKVEPPQDPGVVQQLKTISVVLWEAKQGPRAFSYAFSLFFINSSLVQQLQQTFLCLIWKSVYLVLFVFFSLFNNAGKSEVNTAEKRSRTLHVDVLSQVPQLGGKVEHLPVFLVELQR